MKNPITYEDLRMLVQQQGIAPKANIFISSHFRKTLYYSYSDLEELARLIHQQFNVNLNKGQISSLGTIHDTIELLNTLTYSGTGRYEALHFALDENE